ncbi:MAG: glycosyltransferase family 2 protein [Anaerolineae bacterium]|nr:glycosyltransferase family 2 protein [Anaerolineae bacterium]MDK1082164.1 glycosyltransferase family 2 protein [Anaerolineae bacterium]
MERELISIIMPAKNASSYVGACIESIILQEETNWELIVVNDNSSDSTKSIAENFGKVDTRISVIDNQGAGIIEALKTAYQHAKGEFVTRMDSDDVMPSIKLKELKKELSSAGKGSLSTGLVEYFPKADIGEGFKKYEEWLNRLCATNSHYQEIYKECVVASPCWMMYKADFENLGAFNSIMYPEDYELVFRFYEKRLKIASSNKVLHLWRDHPERASRNDDNYASPHFFDLKMTYFMKLDYDKSKELILWGTGAKGKFLADNLQARGVDFTWMCDNKRKHGVNIKGVIIEDFMRIENRSNFQLIIAVAQRNAQEKMKVFLKSCGLTQNEDYFFFC